MDEIQVLGTGCRSCVALFENAQKAVHFEATKGVVVEKITDLDRIAEFKPWALPALVVRGKVVIAGRIATPAEIRSLLAETKST